MSTVSTCARPTVWELKFLHQTVPDCSRLLRPDIVILNKNQKKAYLIDVTCQSLLIFKELQEKHRRRLRGSLKAAIAEQQNTDEPGPSTISVSVPSATSTIAGCLYCKPVCVGAVEGIISTHLFEQAVS